MSFFCPHCHTENLTVAGQTCCLHCHQPFDRPLASSSKSTRQTSPRKLPETNSVNDRSRGKSPLIVIVGVLLLLMVVLGCCSGVVALLFWSAGSLTSDLSGATTAPEGVVWKYNKSIPAEAKAAFERRPHGKAALPLGHVPETYAPFLVPDAGKKLSLGWSDVYRTKFGNHLKTYSSSDPPGARMTVRMYLPPNLPADAQIPCVLLAPAGSNLLSGKNCGDLEYTTEIKPYVVAGMAVLHYSLDASLDGFDDRAKEKALPRSFSTFCEANGGVVNGQRAIDFALQRFDQIDAEQLYCAGHSSAGTVALQLASTDRRIRKCVAYAPAPSLEKRFADLLENKDIDLILPKLRLYINQWSPDNRIEKFNCPVFIYHSRDDNNTPYVDAKSFHDQLVDAGKDSTLATGKRGGHYQPMVDEGIAKAIEWLKLDIQ